MGAGSAREAMTEEPFLTVGRAVAMVLILAGIAVVITAPWDDRLQKADCDQEPHVLCDSFSPVPPDLAGVLAALPGAVGLVGSAWLRSAAAPKLDAGERRIARLAWGTALVGLGGWATVSALLGIVASVCANNLCTHHVLPRDVVGLVWSSALLVGGLVFLARGLLKSAAPT